MQANAGAKRALHSLALSVHFRQPDFGMKKHEILSRATAFLLAVDPPEPLLAEKDRTSNPYAHLEHSEAERKARRLKQDYSPEPAGGPPRDAKDLGWLEFCPKKFRPVVHCVAASHVIAPWMWKNYYAQDWLSQVELKHCSYSLEVFDPQKPAEALAKFALNPYPIHHPSGMDLAIMHLKQEETALKHMTDLGVEVLHLRDEDKIFNKGDNVTFDGFEIAEENVTDKENLALLGVEGQVEDGTKEDTRVFFPYTEAGALIFSSANRILASTDKPLPEGLCGGPTIDSDGRVCGIVEGIVPTDHEDKRMAGAASFIPSPIVREFTDFAERGMLEQIVPKKLFEKVVQLKAGMGLNEEKGEIDMTDPDGDPFGSTEMDNMYDEIVSNFKKHHSKEEVEALLATVQREKQEVMDIINREGGDLDEVIARVRQRTREEQQRIISQVMEGSSLQEAETVEGNENDALEEKKN